MSNNRKIEILKTLRNEELMYGMLFSGIVISFLFWPLLNSICSMALFVYWLFFSKKEFSFSSGKSRWTILFCLLYLLVITGTFYTGNMHEAVFKLQQKSALLIFPVVMGTSSAITPAVYRRTFSVFTWSTFLACLYCIIHGIYIFLQHGTTVQLSGYPMVILKDMSPFILALCCLLSLMYVFQHVYLAKTHKEPLSPLYGYISIAIFLFFFLFLLGNRNILICMCGVFIFFCFRLIPKMHYRLTLLTGLVILLILTINFNPYFNRQWNDLVDFSKENTIQLDEDSTLGRDWGGKTIRLAIWDCSMDIIQKHWLTGVGTGDVQDELQQAYEKRKFYFASRYNRYNAHNQYLQETLASGLPGLIIFTCSIFLPLYHNIIRKKNTLYTLFLLSFAFICITESILEISKGVIWYSFFNALFIFRKS
jgi:O-antigen ligase